MRGRKRKPAALKRLTGSRTKTAGESPVLVPVAGMPICPEWMSDEAKRVWMRAMAIAPWLATADEFKLTAFCQAMADLRWSIEAVARAGHLAKDRNGMTIESPLVRIKNKAMLIVARLGSDLGFDPAARERLTSSDRPPDAAEDEFFGGGGAPLRLAL